MALRRGHKHNPAPTLRFATTLYAMTVKIRVLPSGREFHADSRETVLEAALRSGLSVNYNCGNGSCGDCKARLISGSLADEQFHDYPICEADKNAGYFLMCCARAGSDLEIEAASTGSVDDIPVQQIVTSVSKVERIGGDLAILNLRTPRSNTLRFLAGQHVTLQVSGLPARNKSIASCPCNAMVLQFHFRATADDTFNRRIIDGLRSSDKVTIEGPWGVFVLDESSTRPIIFVAYETGFAPIKSIIEHAIALEITQPMHLYWLVDREGGHYMNNYCRSWVDALDDFRYTPLVGEGGKNLAQNFTATGEVIGHDHPDLSGHDVYLCGPDSIMDPLIAELNKRGLPETQLHVDALKRY